MITTNYFKCFVPLDTFLTIQAVENFALALSRLVLASKLKFCIIYYDYLQAIHKLSAITGIVKDASCHPPPSH